MPYSNKNELSRLFGTFCHLWLKGHHAKVQMETTQSGGVLAQFEIELEKPHEPFPAGLPGFRRGQSHRAPRQHPDQESGSTNAPGLPGTTSTRPKSDRAFSTAFCSTSGLSESCPLLCTNNNFNTHAHATSYATPYATTALPGTFNQVDQSGTETGQQLFELLTATGRRPGRHRHGWQ